MAVQSLCYKPDFSQLIVACANDLFFISPETGEIIEQKRSHHATIYCVRCSADGALFASGSSDGAVVIWRSLNNDVYVSLRGNTAATNRLEWCPTKQLLITTAKKTYSLWPLDVTIQPTTKQVQNNIENVAFSPNGNVFVLTYSNGTLHVLSTEDQTVLQTFTYSSIVSAIRFFSIDEKDYLITSDLDCRISMYRTSDKALVGKNAIPFEALCCNLVGDSSFFLIFAGISGRISLLTSSLSYLGDFQTSSEWIWDMAVDRRGRIAIASKEGFVELLSIEFGIAFSLAGDIAAYRTSVNAMSVKNIVTGKMLEIPYNKVIASTTLSCNRLLVQFKDSVVVSTHECDPETKELKVERIGEIPGHFENSQFVITRSHIHQADGNILKFYDASLHSLMQFTFSSAITCMSALSTYSDGVVTGLEDGRVFFVTIDMKEPVLLVRHSKRPIAAKRSGLLVAVLDADGGLTITDSFERKTVNTYENVKSFAWSDRVEGLIATSDGTEVTINYKECEPLSQFIEGEILGFSRNKIILSNKGAVETIDAALPFKELMKAGDWPSIKRLCDVGPTTAQLSEIATEALRQKQLDVARLIAPSVNMGLSLFVSEVINDTPEDEVDSAIASFLGDEPAKKQAVPEQGAKARAIELEKGGSIEDALSLYAECDEWDDVFRLAVEKHMERAIVDFKYPEDQAEKAAKVMLSAGLGEGAIRLLTKAKDVGSLAKAYIFLGQWVEAISLSRLYASVYNIVYPRFGQLLFESGKYFESLVCFFIPKERDERTTHLTKMVSCAAEAHQCDQLSFLYLMLAFNDPELYWRILERSQCYYCANRLKNLNMLSMSVEDAKSIFFMSYYVIAGLSEFPLMGVDATDVLLQLIVSASALGLKRWVSYALKEINAYKLDDKSKQVAQKAARYISEAEEVRIEAQCPRCHRDVYSSSRAPTLCCGFCGMRIAFSTHSARPLPLVAFSYFGDDGEELIAVDPPELSDDVPGDVASAKFLATHAPEMFVVRSLKEKSLVKPSFWFNPILESVRVCSTCGSMFSEEDWEASTLDLEHCPICHTTRIETEKGEEEKSEILDMLLNFQEESPVTF